MDTSLNLLKPNNYITINVSTIKVLGLSGAVYCSEIFNRMKKIAMLDIYQVKIDRDDIAERLGIPINEQKAIEDRWKMMKLIEDMPNSSNEVFKVNVDTFSNILLGSIDGGFNKEEVAKIKKKLAPKTSEKDKEAKRYGIAKKIKDNLVCPDVAVKEKIDEWIDFITSSDRTLSANLVNVFMDTIKSYSKGNTSIMIKIIQEAINCCTTNVTYAIKSYEDSLKNKKVSPEAGFRRAVETDLSGGHKF